MAGEKEGNGGGFGGLLVGLGLVKPKTDGAQASERPPAAPPTAPTAPTAPHRAAPTAPRTVVSATPATRVAAAPHQIDPKIYEILRKPVDVAAAPAYTAYQATMASLADLIPDERTRMTAAVRTLPTSGTNFPQLITDLDESLVALDGRLRELNASAERSMANEVGTLEQQLKHTEDSIRAKREQIARLEQEIASEEAGTAGVRETIATTRERIEQTQRDVVAAAEAMRREITETKAKLLTLQQTGA